MNLIHEILESLPKDDPEERQLISGVSWEGYQSLLDTLGESGRYRITYDQGFLNVIRKLTIFSNYHNNFISDGLLLAYS
ncbi:hypothetical protein FRE64_14190 [Euhalothece natronophila Z-M001]|uniref:Uncharacterized protein n=1 Tax=Euhalothece natronophila Z-M001 TaxID=522448 RepID=A0A5B8NPN0_9CHRO|nr:hypothetical protein [Euhalothece natronophila]QDZ40988.1 hypothetical protein FRE64_14190 [Euhalothece natronophila Z-M001]